MAFMSAAVSTHKEFFLISDKLEDAINLEYEGVDLPVGRYDDNTLDEVDDFTEDQLSDIKKMLNRFGIDSFEVVHKFSGELSAPGYLDRTDYFLGDTRADVAQQLLDMFFDDEYLDPEEIADRAWLESIIEEEKEAA